MKKHLIIIIILFPLIGFSQLDISITSNVVPIYVSDGDTLSSCRDSVVSFTAVVTDAGVPVTGAEYVWDFDHGNPITGTDTINVFHIYSDGGGYRVKLKVTKGADEWFTILPIKIAMEPNYSETKIDIPEEHDGICLGSSAPLIGKAYPELWEDEPIYEVDEGNEGNFFEFNDNYTSSLTFDEFALDAVFSSGDIDSVGIEILHADMGDLQITLSCENSSVVLKNYDASNHALLGDTAIDINEAYTYYWSSSASVTINSATTFNNIVPASAYLPEGSFDALIGCPLNGDWTIEINDSQDPDSGFVYSWSIIFQEDVLPDVWTFHDTLVQYKIIEDTIYGTYWEKDEFSGGSVLLNEDTIMCTAIATPDDYNTNRYYFNVITNWGCPQDTFVNLLVEEASFTAEPNPVFALIESVKFTNTTSWAFERQWKFGDKNTSELTLDTASIYHIYEIKDEYDAILIVTDEQGCTDTDTITIIVEVEPTKLENIPNMFSPDGDGTNDRFYINSDKLAGMIDFRIRIYNRWGDKVFESTSVEEMNDKDKGWDGSIMNRGIMKASPGIYFYVIEAFGKDENEYKVSKNPDKAEPKDGIMYTEEVRGTIHLFREK